jgi:chromosome partitioning protein
MQEEMSMKLLLIEDDPSFTSSIEMIFRAESYTCHTTALGVEGVNLGKQSAYDIIILELMLPDLDGFEVLRQLKLAKIKTPVLILSGLIDLDHKIKAFALGAQDYVTKPFNRTELVARVRTIVRRSKGQGAWPAPFAPQQHNNAPPAELKNRDWTPVTLAATGKLSVPAKTDMTGKGQVVVVGNTKGGTGKTTVAMHMIGALLNEGYKVGSVDLCAPQGVLTRYLENRRILSEERGIDLAFPEHFFMSTGDSNLAHFKNILDGLVSRCDYVVIDTPCGEASLSRLAHAFADILITPINDSLVDLESLALVDPKTLDFMQMGDYGSRVIEAISHRAKRGLDKVNWIVLVNRHSDPDQTPDIGPALEKLAGKMGFAEVLTLGERKIYRKLFLAGLTLFDLRQGRLESKQPKVSTAALEEVQALLSLVRTEHLQRQVG